MKILYVTTIGSTMGFFQAFIKELLDAGHTVDIASNVDAAKVQDCYYDWGCNVYPISTSRSPLSLGNLKAVGQIKELVEKGRYDIVHCHTPIAAACTRLACRGFRKKGVKVIYTAHGFHFYTGAPLQNWLIFYTVEKLCARWTDVLITINKEDYQRAQEKLHARRVEYVPGVGIHAARFADTVVDKTAKRKDLGVPEDAFLLFSVGELNANKNHEVVIKALAAMGKQNVHYMIAGQGDKKEHLLQLAQELQLDGRVHLLGFRTDVAELYKTADLFVFPSFREGLSVSVMEAMASGLPCVVSNIRGNQDLIKDEKGGYLVSPADEAQFAEAIGKLMNDQASDACGKFNSEEAKQYNVALINGKMHEIYTS